MSRQAMWLIEEINGVRGFDGAEILFSLFLDFKEQGGWGRRCLDRYLSFFLCDGAFGRAGFALPAGVTDQRRK